MDGLGWIGWIAWPVAASLVVAVLCWCFWEFVHKRGRVGTKDLSLAIHETLSNYSHGTRILLTGIRSDARVSLTKWEDGTTGATSLELVVSGHATTPDGFAELAAMLSVLGVQHTIESSAGHEFRAVLSAEGVEREVWRRVVDRALLAAGLNTGERYRYEFKGDVAIEALKAYAERKRAGLE